MSAPAKSEATTEVAIFAPANPVAVLTSSEEFDAFYADIAKQVRAHVPDLTTEKGRAAIKSLAYKVARTKTAIDDAGKTLTEEWRSKINIVDRSRREIRERLDALKDEARAPLTKWEEDEAARIKLVDATLSDLREQAVVHFDETAEDVAARLAEVANRSFDADLFQSHLTIAENLQRSAAEALTAAHARLVREESDRRELEILRAQNAEREERERIERERQAELAAMRAGFLAICHDLRRREEAKAKADSERAEAIARAEREAAEQARLEAERKAAAEIAEANARAAKAEFDRLAEIARAKREQDARDAQAKAEADAQAKREANKKHRATVMGAAKTAIMKHGVDEETARKIVLAIVAGEVPAVKMEF